MQYMSVTNRNLDT